MVKSCKFLNNNPAKAQARTCAPKLPQPWRGRRRPRRRALLRSPGPEGGRGRDAKKGQAILAQDFFWEGLPCVMNCCCFFCFFFILSLLLFLFLSLLLLLLLLSSSSLLLKKDRFLTRQLAARCATSILMLPLLSRRLRREAVEISQKCSQGLSPATPAAGAAAWDFTS